MDVDSAGFIKLNYVDTFSIPRFFQKYQVYRSVDGGNFTLYDNIYGYFKNNYFDFQAPSSDSINYCYFFKAYNNCSEVGNNSDTICSLNQLTVKSLSLTQSIVNNAEIEITYDHQPDNSLSVFFIEKKINKIGEFYLPYKTINGFNSSSFIDENQNTNESAFCYRITKQNQCGKLSKKSNESCSILLKGTSLPLQNMLEWTQYAEWENGVSYYSILRKKKSETQFNLLINLASNQFQFTDSQMDQDAGTYNYLIKAINDSLGYESVSNIIELEQEALIYASNAFSPNNDGRNDTWMPYSNFVKTLDLKIYNRWGNIVFESINSNPSWDGTSNGIPAPQGIYFYLIKYTNFIDNTTAIKKGSLTLIR
jgi:gliding motility-associated-like protein